MCTSQFTSIADLCFWTICNFYYEFARNNAKERADNLDSLAMSMYDGELILMRDRDYKIRRWYGCCSFYNLALTPSRRRCRSTC